LYMCQQSVPTRYVWSNQLRGKCVTEWPKVSD
jgi:hypothetical protein